MRFPLAFFVAGLTLCALISRADAQAPLENPPFVSSLGNGLTVVVLEDTRFPLVAVRLYVHAGSTCETPREAGISHVLEHMVFKGTRGRPAGAIAAEVEAAGGYTNAATSFDYTVYQTDMPARHWKLGMDVVQDMACNPTLDARELEAEKEVIVAELQRGKDSPSSLLFEALQAKTLAGTPYARPIIGFADTIRSFTSDDIRAYIEKYYHPQAMTLVVAGDVKAGEVLAEAERLFGSRANAVALPAPALLDVNGIRPGEGLAVSVIPGAWNKVYLAMAFPVPGINDIRSTHLDMLAYLLAGEETSFLRRRYKYELQLVDGISATNMNFERLGMLYIAAELAADKVKPFWDALTQDLAGLSAGRFTDEELARAKLNIEDDLFRMQETLGGIAAKLGYFQLLTGDGIMGERNVIESLRVTGRQQVQAGIDTWLRPDRLRAVLLVPQTGAAELPEAETLLAGLRRNWKTPAARPDALPDVQTGPGEVIDLGNNRTLVLIPDATLPYVSAELAFHGGDSLLAPTEQGLAELTARTLTRGAGRRGALELQAWLGDRAASLEAAAARRNFSLDMTMPAAFAADMFAMLREVVLEPAFADEDVEREKQGQIADIHGQDDRPLEYAFRRLPAFLFPGSIFGYYHAGQEQDINAYTAQSVRAFWDRQRVQPWVLSVVGRYDREAVITAARALPQPNRGLPAPAAPAWTAQRELSLRLPNRNQAHYLLIFKTVPVGHEDAPALSLLQAVLAGQSGLLFRDLRDDKGLGYTVAAFDTQNPAYGYLCLYIGTSPDTLEEAGKGFERVIAELHETVLPEAAVNRGKQQLEGSYYRERQSLGSRCSEAARLTLEGRPLNFPRRQIDKAFTITAEDLRAVARKYIRLADARTVTVVP
jgi:zinc protease